MLRTWMMAGAIATAGCSSSDAQPLPDDSSDGAFTSDAESIDPLADASETAAPDTTAPDTATPDTAAPDTAAHDTAAPDTAAHDAPPTPPCKRGIAYGQNSVADLKALSKGISWWYDWSPAPEAAVASAFGGLGLEFAPMVWGGTFTEADVESKVPKGSTHLLGFNEPNFFSQSNLTPKQAAALWPKIESIAAAKGLKIVSPALNYCGGGCNVTDPYDWFDQFFAACPGCKVDAIAVHWYACTKSALTNYLGKFESKFGKPLWLTEFSCLDGSDTSEPVQQAYMKDALGVLESDPMVERYAWFTGRWPKTPSISLLGADGTLTPLGKTYVEWPEACR